MADGSMGAKLGVVVAGILGIFVLVSLLYTYRSKSSDEPGGQPTVPLNTPIHTSAKTSPPQQLQPPPNIDFQCLQNHIEGAPAPFHLSYKKSTQLMNSDWEADITTSSINGTVVDSTGARTIQATRGNKTSWNAAVAQLNVPISGSARTLGLVRNSSAATRAGEETVNGENTVKYTIDSAHDTAADAGEINSLLGAGGFIRGTAWVAKDGCPVKLVLDAQMHMPDGNVEKEHYEEDVTQKAVTSGK